ncbi:MAG: hypothetical protein WBE20_05170 [Candidatus Acidiferrales bacterium]
MTRRGSLAYYLAAWVCGCSFISLCIWAKTSVAGSSEFGGLDGIVGLLFSLFYGLMYSAPAALLSAFLLRRAARLAKCDKVWQWMLLGTAIITLIFAALGWMGGLSQMHLERLLRYFIDVFSGGPSMVFKSGWWLAIPAGAATAWVLFRTDRAFGAPSSDPAA